MQASLELIPEQTRRVFLAYSGGLDSSVLLHLLLGSKSTFAIIPWHINHGLIAEADAMEAFCVQQANDYGLELRLDRLELGKLQSNLEAEAREHRYRLFSEAMIPGDCLLTAHHGDDQAETFLLNALRGSGSAGLRGIAVKRNLGEGILVRPLLDYSRAQLQTYADEQQLSWFDDPSNQSDRYERNFLRNKIIPDLERRWPQLRQSLVVASELQAQAQELLDELAQIDLAEAAAPDNQGIATLHLPVLLKLTPSRCKNLIRYWIARQKLTALPRRRLQELLKQLSAREDALPQVATPEYSIRIYDQRLFLVIERNELELPCRVDFATQTKIEVDDLGLHWQRDAIFELLHCEDNGQQLSLKFRSEPQLESDDKHRLKRLFQKHRVPPWQRNTTAQVYLDEKLEGILP